VFALEGSVSQKCLRVCCCKGCIETFGFTKGEEFLDQPNDCEAQFLKNGSDLLCFIALIGSSLRIKL